MNTSEIQSKKTKSMFTTDKSKKYLYVPFTFKEHAKTSGAKWDNISKHWYTTSDRIDLIELYHRANFYTNYYGTHLHNNWQQLKESKQILDKEIAEGKYRDMDPITFSVNVLGHE